MSNNVIQLTCPDHGEVVVLADDCILLATEPAVLAPCSGDHWMEQHVIPKAAKILEAAGVQSVTDWL